MYPCDSITIFKIISLPNESVLPTGNYTILSTHLVSDYESNINLFCGENLIAATAGQNKFDDNQVVYRCQNSVIASNVATSQGLVSVVYVNRDIASSTAACENHPMVSGGFTYGELVISFFVALIFIGAFTVVVYKNFLKNE